MQDKKCIICEKKQSLEVLYDANFNFKTLNYKTFSARRIPDGTHYRFLKCKNCGLIFSSPILGDKELAKLYSISTFDYSNESRYLRKTYINYFKKYVFNKKIIDKQILEVGCGNGFFLEELEKLGIKNLYGVEPGISSVNMAKSSIKKTIKVAMFRKSLFPKIQFDAICCFHTFDHLINPEIFLKDIFSLLQNKGKAFFVVHDTKGLSVKLLGQKSPIFDIEHIYLFNESNIKLLFEKQGFKDVRVFKIKNTYEINYWFKLTPIPLVVKQFILYLLKVTRIGEISVSMNAGNIGVVGSKLN
jgi:SAM-dependent methyltransferase